MIYAIDFDGTIVEDAYPAIGKINIEALIFIHRLKQAGHIFILHTCRHGRPLREALEFLHEMELDPHYVNRNVPELIAKYGDCRKIYADYYIDDHNVGGVVWPFETLEKK